MKDINQWLLEYGDSHQNSTNKLIHWFCVPVIYFTIIGLLYSIPIEWGTVANIKINVGSIVALLIFVYYLLLSFKIAVGMLVFSAICLALSEYIYLLGGNMGLMITCIVLFVIAWILQFVGHNIEGKKPSFLKDIQYLMIGPAWVISALYKKLGLG